MSNDPTSNTPGEQPAKRETSLAHVVFVALLPALIYSIGQGAIIPIIPAVAASMGAGLEFAGFIAGAIMIGQTFGNIPAGPLVSRIGEKRAMIAGALLAVVGTLISTLATNTWTLLAGILVIGFSAAIFNLARHAFLTTYAPLKYRARVLSTLGGTLRAGLFIGPLLSAGIIAVTGLAHAAFWILVVCSVLVVIVLLVVPDVEDMVAGPRSKGSGEVHRSGASGLDAEDPTGAVKPADASGADAADAGDRTGAVEPADASNMDASGSGDGIGADKPADASGVDPEQPTEPRPERTNVWTALVTYREVLLRLGIGAGLMNLLRGARNVILPLWALSIGMDDASTALVIGVSGGIDFALFFTSGWIMDRFGRVWSAVPSMAGLGIGLCALAFLHDVPAAEAWFVAIAIWLGVCNGIGSGIVMTLGADLAPRAQPAPFLGAWHLIVDASSASVPFIIAGVTAAFALPATVGTLGGLGLVGAVMMARWIPRYVTRGGSWRRRPKG